MTKNQAISKMILEAITEGKDVKEAIDSVLGVGTFDALSGNLYAALRGE